MSYTTYSFKVKTPNPGKVRRLLGLMSGPWRRGLNFCVEQAKQHRPGDAWALHRFVYRHLRGPVGLGAQLAEACRDKAYEAYASYREQRKGGCARGFPHWNGVPPLRLNIPRSLRLFTRKGQYWAEVTVGGPPIRLRIAGTPRALEHVWQSAATHGEIVYARGDLFLHIATRDKTKVTPAPKCLTAIGVDLNVTGHLLVAVACDLAGTVLGTFWVPVGRLNEKRRRARRARAALQRAGRRDRVKAMKNRESRAVEAYLEEGTTLFVRWAAQFPAPFVALETLTGIRDKVRQTSTAWNRRLHSWPFRSGQDMVRYKGARCGLRVKALRAACSSRYCSRCGSRSTRRSGAAFACQRCGYGQNAHLNGARNMSWRATRYILAAAGRADPGAKPGSWGGHLLSSETAERQSGPDGESDDERPLSSHTVSLRWPFRASPKPRTSVRGS